MPPSFCMLGMIKPSGHDDNVKSIAYILTLFTPLIWVGIVILLSCSCGVWFDSVAILQWLWRPFYIFILVCVYNDHQQMGLFFHYFEDSDQLHFIFHEIPRITAKFIITCLEIRKNHLYNWFFEHHDDNHFSVLPFTIFLIPLCQWNASVNLANITL